MPKSRVSKSDELKELICAQERDHENRPLFPEKITPGRPLFFSALTQLQKACMVLSFFMSRREIAETLKISSNAVGHHRKRSFKKLPQGDVIRYRKVNRKRTEKGVGSLLIDARVRPG
jgi:DNA-binding NarL/FixJ family response regulator